jgi:hypothetical protein
MSKILILTTTEDGKLTLCHVGVGVFALIKRVYGCGNCCEVG